MDINLSSEQFETLYQNALAEKQEASHAVPKILKSVEELQQNCRICGCSDDGTFIALDDPQEFEFESSISSYRALFQHTSLQFQFHTMPDLPARICGLCSYKAKVFYLFTRQFVDSQNAMRSSITEWYRNRYNIEPPEQLDDRERLNEQLALAKSDPYYSKSVSTLSSALESSTDPKPNDEPLTPVKDLIEACGEPRLVEIKRSASVDDRFDDGDQNLEEQISGNETDAVTARKNNFKGGQMTKSTANLRPGPLKSNTSLIKMPSSQHSYPAQTARGAHSQVSKLPVPSRGRCISIQKIAAPRECIVTPRMVKAVVSKQEGMLSKAFSNPTSSSGEFPLRPDTLPSKNQMQQQKQLHDRRRQWR